MMQQQITARPARTRTAKPRTPATVRMVHGQPGHYLVSSSDPSKPPYHVDAVVGQCDCPGFGYRQTCRHLSAATITWAFHLSLKLGRQPMMRLSGPVAAAPTPVAVPTPKATWRRCSSCGASYYGTLASGWCGCLPAPEDGPKLLTPRHGGSAGLMEAFGS